MLQTEVADKSVMIQELEIGVKGIGEALVSAARSGKRFLTKNEVEEILFPQSSHCKQAVASALIFFGW